MWGVGRVCFFTLTGHLIPDMCVCMEAASGGVFIPTRGRGHARMISPRIDLLTCFGHG